MATATLPLRLLSSKTPALHAATFLPTRTSLSLTASAPRHWRILASAEEAPAPVESEVVEEAAEEVVGDAEVPEPVEVQLAAAGAGKDADIFAVVMVG
jgi:large subunit ribosomal protein L21